MLRAIADYAMQGRWKAAVTAAFFSVSAILLPPLNYLASGVIALATLRMGPKEGFSVLLATMIVFTLLAGLLVGNFRLVGLVMGCCWLPVYLATLTLGYTRSLAVSILTTSAMGLMTVLFMHLFIGELNVWWQQIISPVITELSLQPGWQLSSSQNELLIMAISGMMTGLLAASVCLNAVIGVLFGRSWQSKLYNPGAFGVEFKQLKLGKPAALITLVLMVLALSSWGQTIPLLVDVLPVMLVTFMIQGLAIVHSIVAARNMAKGWLIVMYILLVVMLTTMLMMLAILGVLDQWFDFRRRFQNRSANN